MEKKKSFDWNEIIESMLKTLIAAILILVLSIFAFSALIYQDIVPIYYSVWLLYLSIAVEAFFASFFLTCISKHQLLVKAFLAQGALLLVLLLIGTLNYESIVNWGQFAIGVIVALLSAMIAILVFGGGQKKKFKKNAAIRLKKK